MGGIGDLGEILTFDGGNRLTYCLHLLKGLGAYFFPRSSFFFHLLCEATANLCASSRILTISLNTGDAFGRGRRPIGDVVD